MDSGPRAVRGLWLSSSLVGILRIRVLGKIGSPRAQWCYHCIRGHRDHCPQSRGRQVCREGTSGEALGTCQSSWRLGSGMARGPSLRTIQLVVSPSHSPFLSAASEGPLSPFHFIIPSGVWGWQGSCSPGIQTAPRDHPLLQGNPSIFRVSWRAHQSE